MTPKQEERIKNKIKKVKAALAADKKQWGGYYHDGKGLRYSPLRFYIQLGDFSGGLRYLNWFNKNFPDDKGFPDFLFEWTVVLFKTGRHKEAEKKAFDTFTGNIYLFDKFFGRPITPIEKWEASNVDMAEFAVNNFEYSHEQDEFLDFAEWLDCLIKTEKFIRVTGSFIEISKRLKNESNFDAKKDLLTQVRELQDKM